MLIPHTGRSAVTPEQLGEFVELRTEYRPNEAIAQQMGDLAVTTVSGPSGIGKDTSMRAAGLHTMVACTTRPSRPGEVDGADYFFMSDIPETYATLLDQIRRRELVQFEVGFGDFLYWSNIDAYQASDGSQKVLLDNTAKAVTRMRELPFGAMRNVYLITEFTEWLERFMQSRAHALAIEKIEERLKEAVTSTEFALEDGEFVFVHNYQTDPDAMPVAAHQLRRIADDTHDPRDDRIARRVAEKFVVHARQQIEV